MMCLLFIYKDWCLYQDLVKFIYVDLETSVYLFLFVCGNVNKAFPKDFHSADWQGML